MPRRDDGERRPRPASSRAGGRRARRLVSSLVIAATLWLLLAPARSWGVSQPAVAAQPNGKVLVTVERDKEIKVARLRRNGKLDRRFGERGFASTGLGKRAAVADMIVAPSGAIDLAAGFGGTQFSSFAQAVIQLTKDGRLEPDFGVDGLANPFAGRGVINIGGLARSADGRLLVAAEAGTAACLGAPTQEPCVYTQLVAGLDASGQLDAGFGEDGVAATPVPGRLVDLAVTGEGRIVTGTEDPAFVTSYVSRLTPDGSLDPTFANGVGFAQTTTPVKGVAVAKSGEIYAGGANNGVFAVTALSEDGSIDQGFASDGAFVTEVDQPTGGGFGALVYRPDGDLVLAGPVGASCVPRDPAHAGARRCRVSASLLGLEESGSPVPGFGDGGVATVSIARSPTKLRRLGGGQVVDSPAGLRVAASFRRGSKADGSTATAVAAVRDSGRLDRRYARNGVALVPTD